MVPVSIAEHVDLPELSKLALASAASGDAGIYSTLFALDDLMARMVSRRREPALAQIRLAWWREQLVTDASVGGQRDPLLIACHHAWQGELPALADLVDGWEHLLADEPLDEEQLAAFAQGRASACSGLARRLGQGDAAAHAARAGRVWSLAECASSSSDQATRLAALSMAKTLLADGAAGRLPARLRPLAVIEGLARRSIARGGAPLIGDRLSPLVALRLGVIGR